MREAEASLLPAALFEKPPIIPFAPEEQICPRCSLPSVPEKTRKRTVTTLAINKFIAHEAVHTCSSPSCHTTIVSKALARLIPSYNTFGYDLIVHVGMQMFLHCRNEKEIVNGLVSRGIKIARSTIGVLAKKFIIYLSIAHNQSRLRIKSAMKARGGYILHLDGTCDADSPHLMSVVDGMSDLVLGNAKVPTENSEHIVPFLRRIKKTYGTPVALVHDLSKAILLAVKRVFPQTPDFLCHFHFLRDIGKDLLLDSYDALRKRMSSLRIQALLRHHARNLKRSIEQNTASMDTLEQCLNGDTQSVKPPLVALVYVAIQWVLDGKRDGDGYGFPFDRPCLTMYQRLIIMHTRLKTLRQTCSSATKGQKHLLTSLINGAEKVVADAVVKKNARLLEDKAIVFDKLRSAMRIAEVEGKGGLNDTGKGEMASIKNRVVRFCRDLTAVIKKRPDPGYVKMFDQIKLYWNKLFADPIIVMTKNGPVPIYPQRTNNIMERFFRDLRRGHRKRSGTNTMSRTLKTIIADTPLVANLHDPAYLAMLLNGAKSLEERFSQIDAQLVREEWARNEKENRTLSPQVKRIIKRRNLMDEIAQIITVC